MRFAISAAVALLLAGGLHAATVPELKDLFDRGDYPTVIREADRTMVADRSLDNNELYQMIMLKAEAMLRSGSRSLAAQEFGAAARIAPTLEQLAWSRSTRVLLDRTTGLTYTPRLGENRQPMDVVDTTSRRQAFAALLDDLRPTIRRQYENAMQATTLPALEDAILPISDAAFLEIASTGQTKEMMPLLNELGKHAQQLIQSDLLRIQRTISHINRVAASFDEFGGRRGITSRERDELFDLDGYLDRVNERVQQYRQAAMRLGGETKEWDRILLEVVALQTDVDIALSTRY